MNNPLIFTDPSGYRPDLIFEEERRMSAGQDFGGGGGGSWNPFGWISRSMRYVGWTDNVGPSRADYDYWAANIRGNAAFGEAANSVGKWYQNRRNLQVNWEIALEMGMEFLSTDYQYGGNDIFYTNSDGRSGYLRSYLAVLVDQIIDRAIISEMQSLGQSPRGYGMMLGDPKNVDWDMVVSGAITTTGGTLMMVGGIAAIVTGVGAPAGAVSLTFGAPTFGFGVSRIVDGFQGGNQDFPSGFFEATGEGFGGNGSFGQVLDIAVGGLPRNSVSAIITGYSIGNLDYFQDSQQGAIYYLPNNFIAPSNYEIAPRDNTYNSLPIIY